MKRDLLRLLAAWLIGVAVAFAITTLLVIAWQPSSGHAIVIGQLCGGLIPIAAVAIAAVRMLR